MGHLVVWIPARIPKMKGIGILRGILRIPNHRAPNQKANHESIRALRQFFLENLMRGRGQIQESGEDFDAGASWKKLTVVVWCFVLACYLLWFGGVLDPWFDWGLAGLLVYFGWCGWVKNDWWFWWWVKNDWWFWWWWWCLRFFVGLFFGCWVVLCEPRKKPSHFPLYCLFSRDRYI